MRASLLDAPAANVRPLLEGSALPELEGSALPEVGACALPELGGFALPEFGACVLPLFEVDVPLLEGNVRLLVDVETVMGELSWLLWVTFVDTVGEFEWGCARLDGEWSPLDVGELGMFEFALFAVDAFFEVVVAFEELLGGDLSCMSFADTCASLEVDECALLDVALDAPPLFQKLNASIILVAMPLT